jgi:hypothetical protein
MIPVALHIFSHLKTNKMAKQKGIIKIKGTLGDMTFYKSGDGFIVKEKSAVPRAKILNDPSFIRTRENMSEFSAAGKACKLLRTAIRSLLQSAKDSKIVSRLTKEMMKVIKADAVSTRGLRNVIDGETELLKNFDFNINAVWSATVFAAYTPVINRVTGELTVSIPAYNPTQMIVPPEGATHFKLVAAGSDINFTEGNFNTVQFETDYLPLDNVDTLPVNISLALDAASTNPLFLLMGIQFYQQVNAVQYPLRNGAFNALNIVAIEGV